MELLILKRIQSRESVKMRIDYNLIVSGNMLILGAVCLRGNMKAPFWLFWSKCLRSLVECHSGYFVLWIVWIEGEGPDSHTQIICTQN